MMPGEKCRARTLPHPCVEQDYLYFECPEDNIDSLTSPTLVKGKHRTRCKVCRMETVTFNDTDPRLNVVYGAFDFGPNSVEGLIDEEGISEYHIYFADDCGNLLKRIAVIPRDWSLEKGCCTPAAYQVEFHVGLPVNHSNVSVMVIPYINETDQDGQELGLLPIGAVAGFLNDYHDAKQARFYGMARNSHAARQASRPLGLVAAWTSAVLMILGTAVAAPGAGGTDV